MNLSDKCIAREKRERTIINAIFYNYCDQTLIQMMSYVALCTDSFHTNCEPYQSDHFNPEADIVLSNRFTPCNQTNQKDI